MTLICAGWGAMRAWRASDIGFLFEGAEVEDRFGQLAAVVTDFDAGGEERTPDDAAALRLDRPRRRRHGRRPAPGIRLGELAADRRRVEQDIVDTHLGDMRLERLEVVD